MSPPFLSSSVASSASRIKSNNRKNSLSMSLTFKRSSNQMRSFGKIWKAVKTKLLKTRSFWRWSLSQQLRWRPLYKWLLKLINRCSREIIHHCCVHRKKLKLRKLWLIRIILAISPKALWTAIAFTWWWQSPGWHPSWNSRTLTQKKRTQSLTATNRHTTLPR